LDNRLGVFSIYLELRQEAIANLFTEPTGAPNTRPSRAKGRKASDEDPNG